MTVPVSSTTLRPQRRRHSRASRASPTFTCRSTTASSTPARSLQRWPLAVWIPMRPARTSSSSCERGTWSREEDHAQLSALLASTRCLPCYRPVVCLDGQDWFARAGSRRSANVKWYAAHAAKRIGAMVEQRPDWCISRQRNWACLCNTPAPTAARRS
ncbi:MAG: class I tRNA ligase family protein [Collinsella sp.]